MNAAQMAFEMARPSQEAREFAEAVESYMAEMRRLPIEEQRKLARARLLKEGLIRERDDGSVVLHQNYGGPR